MADLLPTSPDPIDHFAAWFAEAAAHAAIRYAHAACLATTGDDGADARMVLVHGFGAAGFVFGTDARSTKARQLVRDPRAALNFHWDALDRQVRIRGRVHAGTTADRERSFDDRPRDSRITAWVSQQSRPVASRDVLEQRWRAAESRFAGSPLIPRPDTWCAFCLVPDSIELWQARRHRLHDRICYTRAGDGRWRRTILEP